MSWLCLTLLWIGVCNRFWGSASWSSTIGELKLLCRFDIILDPGIELGRFDFLLMKTWCDRSIPFGKIAGGEILRYSWLGFGWKPNNWVRWAWLYLGILESQFCVEPWRLTNEPCGKSPVEKHSIMQPSNMMAICRAIFRRSGLYNPRWYISAKSLVVWIFVLFVKEKKYLKWTLTIFSSSLSAFNNLLML